MILECSECRTRYLVPDAAIGPGGRTVRCAHCRHSWFQPGAPALDLVARAEALPPVAPVPPPTPSPAAEPRAADERDLRVEFDAFAHEPPFRPRRNPARRWTMAAVAAGVVMLAAAGAILYSGAPGLASQLGLQLADAETPLLIVSKPIDHHDLDNGSELFAISGLVSNPTAARQHVPDIRAELQDARQRPVYSWTIRPEAMVLPPHGSVAFNSAKTDVPASATRVVLTFSGDTAH